MTSEFDFYNSFTFNDLWLSLMTELRTQLLDRRAYVDNWVFIIASSCLF